MTFLPPVSLCMSMRWRVALEQHVEAAVHQAFLVHARADAGLVHEVDADLLQDAGADARQHVVAGLAFENDGVDAGLVQQLAEQQARRAGADDGNLGTHGWSPEGDAIAQA